MLVKLILKSNLGKVVPIGKNFTVESHLHKPKTDDAKKRYRFTLRSNDKKFYRLYSVQASPGCVHIDFEEACK